MMQFTKIACSMLALKESKKRKLLRGNVLLPVDIVSSLYVHSLCLTLFLWNCSCRKIFISARSLCRSVSQIKVLSLYEIEIHRHPALQCAFADFHCLVNLASTSTGNGTRYLSSFFIFTHGDCCETAMVLLKVWHGHNTRTRFLVNHISFIHHNSFSFIVYFI